MAGTRVYLREWREKRGLTQKELSLLTGISESVISRYETGERRMYVDVLVELAGALRAHPGELFSPPIS